MRASLALLLATLLSGCATTRREAAAEARGYERGYAQAVKEHYWMLQDRQRPAAPPAPSAP